MQCLGAPLVNFLGRRELAIHRTRGTELPLLIVGNVASTSAGDWSMHRSLFMTSCLRLAFGRTQHARSMALGAKVIPIRGAPQFAGDRAMPGTRRRSDTCSRGQRTGVVTARWHASAGLVVVEGCQGDPQDVGNFFLERDDHLRTLQNPLEPAILRLTNGFMRGSTV